MIKSKNVCEYVFPKDVEMMNKCVFNSYPYRLEIFSKIQQLATEKIYIDY